MADQKKMVEEITSMDEDFAKWYTDVVKKAELIDYSSVRGCMVFEPYGYAIWENIPVSYTHLGHPGAAGHGGGPHLKVHHRNPAALG